MKKFLICLVCVLCFLSESAFCVEIGGVNLPETMKGGDSELLLNGYGLRRKFGFKVYAVGLYLQQKTKDYKKILNDDKPMALKMQWRRSVPGKKIKTVFYDSFAEVVKAPDQDDYNENSDYGPLTKEIVTFMNIVAARKVTKKDCSTYVYIPGKGTEIYINDGVKEELKATIPGLEFKKALFGIWLVEDAPVGNGLRDDLLGK